MKPKLSILFAIALGLLGSHGATAQPTQFYCIGAVMVKAGKRYVWEMDGMGRRMKLIFAVYTVAGLSLIGIPPLIGFVSKWYIGNAAVQQGTAFAYTGLAVLILSALLSAAYILEVVVRAWMPKETTGTEQPESGEIRRTGWRMRLPLVLLVTLVAVMGICSQPVLHFLSDVAAGIR